MIDPARSTETLIANRRFATGVLVIGVLTVLGFLFSVAFGSVSLRPETVLSAVFGTADEQSTRIVLGARLPRAICALLCGASLAVSGVLLQSVTRNPLADPGLIGVTAGAGVAATIVLAVLPGYANALPPVAFIGAMASAVFVYAISWQPGGGTSPIRMILAGVAVNAVLAAVIGLLITAFANRIPAVLFWTTGSFNGRSWMHVTMMIPYVAAGLLLALLISPSVRVLELGDDAAATMGIRVESTRLAAFAAASLLAGVATSVAGLIGFVGLVVPHIVRLILGSNRLVLPVSMLAGGGVLLWSDLVARTALAPSEIPVGVVTGLVGGPYFIFLLYRSGWLR